MRELSFNRYMVECESCSMSALTLVDELVLIDTWWNVNDCACLFLQNEVHVLIDTWWNVNIY